MACSAPAPEEVIRDGWTPPGDLWCSMLTEDQVRQLLGDGDLERVRQVGDFAPGLPSDLDCDVVWADDDRPVRLVTGVMSSASGAPALRFALRNLRETVGEGGARISAGEVEQAGPGAYVDVEEQEVAAFLACDEGGPMPLLLHATVEPVPTGSGEQWTNEQLLSVADRLAEMTRRVYDCPGEVSGLGPEEEQVLSERYRELTGEQTG